MCGIVGYIGKDEACGVILNGLMMLEYRGYDSAGISVLDKNKIETVKKAGRLSVIEEVLNKNPLKGNVGIGHTRWATHGTPSDINAHPHMDMKNEFSVVHNGIIENYSEIKNELEKKGFVFKSDTDSEVIPNLIADLYDGDLLSTSKKMIKLLRGAYSLGIISSKEPSTLIAVKKKSPLVMGIAEKGFLIASDVSALLKHTKKVIYLEEDDVVKITPDGFSIYNGEIEVERKISEIKWSVEASSKGGYPHFMVKEIHEQPQALSETISHRIEGDSVKLEGSFSKEELKEIREIKIIGCGTAYHAGLSGRTALTKLAKIPATVEIASEFNYSNPKIDEHTLAIFISQSGETSDVLTALALAKEKNAKILVITNVVGSSISRAADHVLYTWAGPEISVASTKAYTTQLALLYILAIDFARKLDRIDCNEEKRLCSELLKISKKVEDWLKEDKYDWNELGNMFSKSSAFYLGRNEDYNSSREGALKLKELSYVHAEAIPAGELKHGPISLVEKGFPVVAISTEKKLEEKIISNIKEVKARGASVIVITDSDSKNFEEVSKVIKIPTTEELFIPILVAVPLQLLAYHAAALKGRDVDRPRNLAKSVTVE